MTPYHTNDAAPRAYLLSLFNTKILSFRVYVQIISNDRVRFLT